MADILKAPSSSCSSLGGEIRTSPSFLAQFPPVAAKSSNSHKGEEEETTARIWQGFRAILLAIARTAHGDLLNLLGPLTNTYFHNNAIHWPGVGDTILLIVQGSAVRWPLGCVNPASSLPLAAGRDFTQPRHHSFAQPLESFHKMVDAPAEHGHSNRFSIM